MKSLCKWLIITQFTGLTLNIIKLNMWMTVTRMRKTSGAWKLSTIFADHLYLILLAKFAVWTHTTRKTQRGSTNSSTDSVVFERQKRAINLINVPCKSFCAYIRIGLLMYPGTFFCSVIFCHFVLHLFLKISCDTWGTEVQWYGQNGISWQYVFICCEPIEGSVWMIFFLQSYSKYITLAQTESCCQEKDTEFIISGTLSTRTTLIT